MKGVIRIRKWKKGSKHNDKKKVYKGGKIQSSKHTHKAKDRLIQPSTKN